MFLQLLILFYCLCCILDVTVVSDVGQWAMLKNNCTEDHQNATIGLYELTLQIERLSSIRHTRVKVCQTKSSTLQGGIQECPMSTTKAQLLLLSTQHHHLVQALEAEGSSSSSLRPLRHICIINTICHEPHNTPPNLKVFVSSGWWTDTTSSQSPTELCIKLGHCKHLSQEISNQITQF